MREKMERREFVRGCAAAAASAAFAFPRPLPARTQGRSSNACRAYVADLQKRIPDLMRAGGVPGASVALISNGEVIWSQGFGVRDAKTGAPADARTVFEVGALSRLVSACAVLSLSKAGKLGLDENLCRYLPPDYVRANYFVNYLTARQLFTDPHHLLGSVPGKTPCGGKEGAPLPSGYTYVKGFTYLEAVVERVTGQPFPAFVRASVLEPFGMFDSSFAWQKSYAETAGSGHSGGAVTMTLRRRYALWPAGKQASFDKKYSDLKIPAAAGGLYTTANDLARFVVGLMQRYRRAGARSLTDFLKAPDPAANKKAGDPMGKKAGDPAAKSATKTPERPPSRDGDEDDWNFIWRAQKAQPNDLFRMEGNPGPFHGLAAVREKSGVVVLANGGGGGKLFDELTRPLRDSLSPPC